MGPLLIFFILLLVAGVFWVANRRGSKPNLKQDVVEPERPKQSPVEPPVKAVPKKRGEIPLGLLIFEAAEGAAGHITKLNRQPMIQLGREKPSRPDIEFIPLPAKDKSVSRYHALLEFDYQELKYQIRRHPQAHSDTFVNGQVIDCDAKVTLEDKDKIQFGHICTTEFRWEETWNRERRKK